MKISIKKLAVMTNAEIAELAIKLSGFSAQAFARKVIDVDDRTVRRWLAGETFGGTPLLLCLAIIRRPELAKELADVLAEFKAAKGVEE